MAGHCDWPQHTKSWISGHPSHGEGDSAPQNQKGSLSRACYLKCCSWCEHFWVRAWTKEHSLAHRWVAICTASWPSRGSTGRSSAPGPSTWRTCATTSITPARSGPTVVWRRKLMRERHPSAWPTWDARTAWEVRKTPTGNGCPTLRRTDRGAPPTVIWRKTSRTEQVYYNKHSGGRY